MSQLDLTPPVPIAAQWSFPQLFVQFDQPLLDHPLELANWTARLDNESQIVVNAIVSGDTVVLLPTSDEGDPGPNVVNYSATVPDVQGLTGLQAAPFTDFPIA